MNLWAALFSFRGRLSRAPYWLAVLAVAVAAGIAMALAAAIATPPSPTMIVAAALLSLVVLRIGLALSIKRLHDRGKSAWWLLLFYVVPSTLQGIGQQAASAGAIILTLIAAGIGIWAFVELGLLPGTAGDNRFGADPLRSRAAA